MQQEYVPTRPVRPRGQQPCTSSRPRIQKMHPISLGKMMMKVPNVMLYDEFCLVEIRNNISVDKTNHRNQMES